MASMISDRSTIASTSSKGKARTSMNSVSSATRAMAAEFAPHGIRVNALSPGTVDTDMVRKTPPEARAEMTKLQLLQRMAHPDEMVGPALLLSSDAGSFITGQVLFADGGMVPR